jgi:hypothetical protein
VAAEAFAWTKSSFLLHGELHIRQQITAGNQRPVQLAEETADADLLWEKNTVISLKQYGW